MSGEVKGTTTTGFGVKYVVEGVISGPSGRMAAIRTVWVVETGQERPILWKNLEIEYDKGIGYGSADAGH